MFKHILCPIDGSKTAEHALEVAVKLAKEQQANLTICTVVDPSQAAAMAFGDPAMSAACYDALEDEAKARLDETAAQLKDTIAATTVTLLGQPTLGILGCAASKHADLIVMGSHGRGGIQRALIGSVAEGVLRQANVPVMIIRYNEREAKEQPAMAGGERVTA